jgi:DNA mismatch repair protein MutH
MFDYRTASEGEIRAEAELLQGRLLGSLPGAKFSAAKGATGRAEVGHAVEAHFGIPPNSSPLPDFPGAGIELKVVPLYRTGRGLAVKERTVISLIDYAKLMDQTWTTASVRTKLKILFIFFEHIHGMPKSAFPVRGVLLWQPDARTDALIRADWERVFAKVRQGRAHELSESDGALMGPCTKGATGESRRRQPLGDQLAKPRAWALKPSFTWRLYQAVTKPTPSESLLDEIGLAAAKEFETRLTRRFSPYLGRTVADVGLELGVPRSTSKSYAASVAWRTFGGRGFRAKILEFEEMGLTPRAPRVGSDLMPYEHVSFPAFRHRELLDETWEDSALLAHIEYMLFVPIHGPARGTPQGECTFGSPVFWRPSTEQVDLIRREWELFRTEIERGGSASLTPASETKAIHIRPHARDSRDTREAPGAGQVVKQSFWLNRPFVQQILLVGQELAGLRKRLANATDKPDD